MYNPAAGVTKYFTIVSYVECFGTYTVSAQEAAAKLL